MHVREVESILAGVRPKARIRASKWAATIAAAVLTMGFVYYVLIPLGYIAYFNSVAIEF